MQNLTAFHDYDIRGVYPTEINEQFYYSLGRAMAVYLEGRGPVGVGHDMRLSSEPLTKSLMEGLCDGGIDVVFLGMISTEMHYFVSGKYQYEANIVVSASHNPPQYNGVKIVLRGVVPLHGSFGLDKLKTLMTNENYPTISKRGTVTKKQVFSEWIDHALKFVDANKIGKLKVIVDAGSGMGGPAWQEVAKRLPQIDFTLLYTDPDGNFPYHLADPLKDENVKDLVAAIKQQGADVGIALDGDADRIFFFDETGKKLSGNITTAIIAQKLLSLKKGTILYGAICGRIVPETVEKCGGIAIRTRVGHSFIKEQMKKTGAIFAGEHSGHFYYADNFNADSSLITGLLMLQIISDAKNSIASIAEKYDLYPQSGEMNFVAADADKIIAAVEAKYSPDAKSIDKLDGLSIWYNEFWFNIRQSKTEPLLRINIEADNSEILAKNNDELVQFISNLGARPK